MRRSLGVSESSDGIARIIRKIAKVEKRLKAIDDELEQAQQRDLFKLKQQVEEAKVEGRDLLKELSERLDVDIEQARDELKLHMSLRVP